MITSQKNNNFILWCLAIALFAIVPANGFEPMLSAQGYQRYGSARIPSGQWTFGIYGISTSLTGRYADFGNNLTKFDFEADLNLKTKGTGPGIHMDYSGDRFGFSLDYGMQDYAGRNTIDRPIVIGGVHCFEGMSITSSLKNTAYDINGTVKVIRGNNSWLGLDVGIQAWYMDLKVNGEHETFGIIGVEANETFVIPIPQIGISASFQTMQNQLVLSGKMHFMTLKGANFNRISTDVRYYFLPWLAGRLFWDKQSLDAPLDSIDKNIDLKLDRQSLGFGIVARW